MKKTLFDSTILIDFLRNDQDVVLLIDRYLDDHDEITFSAITKYEILRGYEVLRAAGKKARFLAFCDDHQVLPITDEIIRQGAKIYGDLHRSGKLIGDADVLIGATALVNQLPILTLNIKHFQTVKGLKLADFPDNAKK